MPVSKDDELEKQLVSIVGEYGAFNHMGIQEGNTVINSLMALIHACEAEIEKSYGGCHNCYGKGYATYDGEYRARGMRWPDHRIRFCDCERGEQLVHVFEGRDKRIAATVSWVPLSPKDYEYTVRIDGQAATLQFNLSNPDGFAKHLEALCNSLLGLQSQLKENKEETNVK